MNTWRVHLGDVRTVLAELPAESVQTCVTSPPYFGLRDYGADGQIGLEPTPDAYVAEMVRVFREVRRVLRDDGTVFLNLGDSYFGGGRGGGGSYAAERRGWRAVPCGTSGKEPEDYRASDCLCGSLCGACRVAYQTGRSHSGSLRVPMPAPLPSVTSRERRGSQHGRLPTSDSCHQEDHIEVATDGPAPMLDLVVGPPLVSQGTMTDESAQQHHVTRSAVSTQAAGCRLCGCSLADCAQVSARMVACTCDRAGDVSGNHMTGMDASDSAYQHFTTASLKPKDLIGIPWRVAFALQADGWYLRSDIIWHKPNPMPESATDRPTKSHEYIFLLTKSARYHYDATAIREAGSENEVTKARNCRADAGLVGARGLRGTPQGQSGAGVYIRTPDTTRNKRSVWTVATQPYPEAHFATYPEALIEPCILAGSKPGDLVLDPFTGSGTTGAVAVRHQRNFVGVELNPEYLTLARTRIGSVAPMFAQEVA